MLYYHTLRTDKMFKLELLSEIILHFANCICVFALVYVYTQCPCGFLQRPEEGVRYPGTLPTGGCELPIMGASIEPPGSANAFYLQSHLFSS